MLYSVRMRATGARGRHISGAEGIYAASSVNRAARQYILRALSHPRGVPSEVHITVEPLSHRPRLLKPLPLSTLKCNNTEEALEAIAEQLTLDKISPIALSRALDHLKRGPALPGAALFGATTGQRMDPHPERGVRASLLGITAQALSALKRRLKQLGLNNTTVIEALILATKVAYTPGVVAELCISDDPDYTTGYVASAKRGYRRITNIKKKGSFRGGRALFVKEGADMDKIIAALHYRAAMIA